MNEEQRNDRQEGREGEQPAPETAPTEAQPAPEAAPTEPAPRRLFRSTTDRVLGGVAGGLGRYFGIDPIFFRIGFVALTFFGGAGLFLYAAAWIFVPPEGGTHALEGRGRGRALTIIGAVVLAIAALAIVDEIVDAGHWGFGWFLWGGVAPLLLLALVGALVWSAVKDRRREGDGAGASRPDGDGAAWIAGRVALVIAVLAASTVAFFASAVAAAAGGGAVVAALVIAIGLVLVAAAFRGGARWLIVPALVLALPVGVVSAADIDLDGGIGEREYRPSSAAELRAGYELGIGRLELDLRDLELDDGDRQLRVDLGVGEAVVVVPEDVCVALESRVGAGYARLFDRDSGGLDIDWDATPSAPADVSRLVIDADVGMGAVQVVHDPDDAERGPGKRFGRDDFDDDEGDGNEACDRAAAGERETGGRRGTP